MQEGIPYALLPNLAATVGPASVISELLKAGVQAPGAVISPILKDGLR